MAKAKVKKWPPYALKAFDAANKKKPALSTAALNDRILLSRVQALEGAARIFSADIGKIRDMAVENKEAICPRVAARLKQLEDKVGADAVSGGSVQEFATMCHQQTVSELRLLSENDVNFSTQLQHLIGQMRGSAAPALSKTDQYLVNTLRQVFSDMSPAARKVALAELTK
jgi:hypothetical protein